MRMRVGAQNPAVCRRRREEEGFLGESVLHHHGIWTRLPLLLKYVVHTHTDTVLLARETVIPVCILYYCLLSACTDSPPRPQSEGGSGWSGTVPVAAVLCICLVVFLIAVIFLLCLRKLLLVGVSSLPIRPSQVVHPDPPLSTLHK